MLDTQPNGNSPLEENPKMASVVQHLAEQRS